MGLPHSSYIGVAVMLPGLCVRLCRRVALRGWCPQPAAIGDVGQEACFVLSLPDGC